MIKNNLMRLLFASLFLSSFVFAHSNRPNALTFTIAGGDYHFAPKRHLDSTAMPNVLFAYNLDEHWALEGGVGLINTTRTTDSQSMHGFLYLADGIYRFNVHKNFQPYLIAGVGVLGLRPNNYDSEHQGNVNAGIGTQYFADKSIALRVEARDLYTMSGGKNDWLLNFGVSFLIGGDASASS